MSANVTPEMVKQLIKQADEKKIFLKAQLVALEMGTSQNMRHGTHYRFSDPPFSLWYDAYGSNLNILWEEKTVFSVQLGDKMWSYKPSAGPWEEALEKLYIQANEIAKIKSEARNNSDQEERNRMWG